MVSGGQEESLFSVGSKQLVTVTSKLYNASAYFFLPTASCLLTAARWLTVPLLPVGPLLATAEYHQ